MGSSRNFINLKLGVNKTLEFFSNAVEWICIKESMRLDNNCLIGIDVS